MIIAISDSTRGSHAGGWPADDSDHEGGFMVRRKMRYATTPARPFGTATAGRFGSDLSWGRREPPFVHSTDSIPCASSAEISVDPVSCRRSASAASGSFAWVLRAAPIVT